MSNDEWGPREDTQKGMYLRYNSKTKRWYLYNSRNVLVTSNRNKEKLQNWRESE